MLVDDLCGDDDVARDTAGARLSVIGTRAVPQLLNALRVTGSAVAGAAILKVLEASTDRRALDAAIALLHDPATDPKVAAAATALAGAFLDSTNASLALDALSGVLLDERYPDDLRLRALDALERMPRRIIAPLRKRLATDPSEAIRRRSAARSEPGTGSVHPLPSIESIAAGAPADPTALTESVAAAAGTAALPILHRLIEVTRAREESAPARADRAEWRAARGAVHLALAARGSRVALYDLRETLGAAGAPLPADFLRAAASVGDATCLEPVAAALARQPSSIDQKEREWRDQLMRAGRAIVARERLTRRHAVMRRILKTWPAVGTALLSAANDQ